MTRLAKENKMIPVMCIVQQGQVPKEAEADMKAQIDDFTRKAFFEPADIDWIVVPHGSGFTAGDPSQTVVASLHANRPLPKAERTALLRELGDICSRHAGVSPHDVLTSIRNPQE